MTAPVRPLTMRDVLRAYALGERMNDWVLASRAVSHLVPQGSPNYDLCAEMCRLHASTCENDFIGLAEHIVNDATLARLAEVERERHREHEARVQMEHELSEAGCATVADLVRERDEAREERDIAARYVVSIAAWQAEAARLREALLDSTCEDEHGVHHSAPSHAKRKERPHHYECSLCAALASAPGSRDALRAVCERAVAAAADWQRAKHGTYDAPRRVALAAIVARIIGERGKEGGDA